MVPGRLAAVAGLSAGAFAVVCMAGCGQELAVGSDVLWSARFETGDFSEWTATPGGTATAFPAPNMFEASTERVHHGSYAAKLTVAPGTDGAQANVGLVRSGNLPVEAYYSAWYYLPRTVIVGTYWVIFKFRMRTVADDPSTSTELYDLDLTNLPSGEMSLRLYNHVTAGDVALDVDAPVLPVGQWFQIEAFYRNAADSTGRLTYWLDGRPIVDVAGPSGSPTPWVAWDVVSVAVNLTPSPAVLYVDDCAVSRTRVGPTGLIASP
jgi:hypothetical protein